MLEDTLRSKMNENLKEAQVHIADKQYRSELT